MAMVIFSHVEVTFFIFMHEDIFHFFARKLTLYFIGVYLIKSINFIWDHGGIWFSGWRVLRKIGLIY